MWQSVPAVVVLFTAAKPVYHNKSIYNQDHDIQNQEMIHQGGSRETNRVGTSTPEDSNGFYVASFYRALCRNHDSQVSIL